MKEVAVHLNKFALQQSDPDFVDTFGRSAFNRFYYACYWAVRTKLPELHSNWLKLAHQKLPEYLLTSVKKEMLKRLRKLHDANLVTGEAYGSLKARIEYSIREIASILQGAYAIRCIADYQPEEKATKSGDILLLRGHKGSSLATSYENIRKHVGTLKMCRDVLSI